MVKTSKGKSKASASVAPAAAAGPAVIVRRSRRDAPTPKRHRAESDNEEDYESSTEVDPDVLIDSLLSCLIKHEGLLEGFVQNLFKVPRMQDKIVAQVLKLLKATPTENVVNQTVTSVTNDLNDTIKELSDNVKKLTGELKTSKNLCDELEQYSRRNNIIISGIHESDTIDSEDLACSFLNQYAETHIQPSDIDRAHRITRPKANDRDRERKPRDIIVKFCSHKPKAAVLSREPMKQLRADNVEKPEKSRVYVREDLTKIRNTVLYKTRVLKRAKSIKDTFSRDGRIVVKLFTDRLIYITNEDEFNEFCTSRNIKFTDPKSKSKVGTGESGERVSIPMEAENVVSDTGAGDTGANVSTEVPEARYLDPAAKAFTPSQPPMVMGPMAETPHSQGSPSKSLFQHRIQ